GVQTCALPILIQSNKGLNWTTSITGSYFSDTMLKEFVSEDTRYISNAGSPGLNETDLIRVKEGEPVGQIWGPEYAGIDDEGRWLFNSADGEKINSDDVTTADKKVIGNVLQDYQRGR